MPTAPADQDHLLALGTALRPWQECARAGADEVLAHLVEVGDRDTQAALDGYLDTVADLLREIDAATLDLTARLGVAARSAPVPSGHDLPAAPASMERSTSLAEHEQASR